MRKVSQNRLRRPTNSIGALRGSNAEAQDWRARLMPPPRSDLQSAARRMRHAAAYRSRRERHGRCAFRGGESGFTVVELLIAFTILAMATGTLFQMFFAAARNNAGAAELDAAGSKLSLAAEQFKADPAGFGQADPAGSVGGWERVAGADVGAGAGVGSGEDESWGGGIFIKYYDGDFAEAPAPPMAAEARYALAARVSRTDVSLGGGADYRRGAAEIALGLDQDYRIVVELGPFGIEVSLDGIQKPVDGRRVGRVVPISVEFSGGGMLPKRVAVANSSGTPVILNVFGMPQLGDPSEYLAVDATEGEIGVVFYGDDEMPSQNALYSFEAVFVRLGDGDGDRLDGDRLDGEHLDSDSGDDRLDAGSLDSLGGLGSLGSLGALFGGEQIARIEASKYVPDA